jgi:electron transfer flavoprotein-quinone oxidoreductase
MEEETDFDVIVIGAGFAGAATAFQLLKEGIEGERILVVERGEPIGGKNMTGGILWGRELDAFTDYIGNWEMDCPGIERCINHKKVGFLSNEDAVFIEGRFASWDGTGGTEEPSERSSWSVLRAKTDAWLAEKMEEAGIFVMGGIKIDQLNIEGLDHGAYDARDLTDPSEDSGKGAAQKWKVDNLPKELVDKVRNGTISGIVQDGEVMTAKVVVIAEGTNSVLTRAYHFDSMLHAQSKDDMLLGIKEVIHLGKERIDERFNCFPGDDERPPSGMAMELALSLYREMAEEAWEKYPATKGLYPRCGGFFYTNEDTVSCGIIVQLKSLPEGLHTYDLYEAFKAHPAIAALIQGGEAIEYGGHLCPEYGLHRMPHRFTRDGALVVGDAAGLVFANGMQIQGMNNALHSGKLAGKAIAHCIAKGDVSAKALDATYTKSLKASYIFRDLERFEPATKFLNHPANFTWLPELIGKTANRVFREIGEEKVPAEKVFFGVRKELRKRNKANKKGMGLFSLARLGLLGRKL